MFNPISSSRCRSAAMLLAVLSLLTIVSDAAAQQRSFEFRVSSSEMFLHDGDNEALMHIEAWDSPMMRAIKRSRPFIELRNTSTNGAELTEFRMTIGDELYSFGNSFLGDYAVLGTTTPNVNVSSVTALDGGNELLIQFGDGGLDPNEVVRFQVDIDGDLPTQFIHPDYRTVFFDLNDDDDSDNSRLTVTFDSGIPLEGVQPDLPTGSPWINQNLRPYAVMEKIESSGFEEIPVIPEPGTIALTLLALCGACAIGMRRRLG